MDGLQGLKSTDINRLTNRQLQVLGDASDTVTHVNSYNHTA